MINTNGNVEQATASSLLEDLKSNDQKIKINAIQGLNIIAFALGKERTRNELIPFISDIIDEEEEETLIELARILSTFLDFIGGKNYAIKLFKILEILLTLDELSVRNEALISFKKILSQINPQDNDIESLIMDLITRLLRSEYIIQRNSAINLIPPVYKFMNQEHKLILISHLLKLAKEDVPSIKKEIATITKEMAMILPVEIFTDLVNIFTKDTNDSVRIPITDCIVALKNHPKFSDGVFVLDIITKLSQDESWRVRLTVADKINELLNISVSMTLKKTLVDVFVKLLQDKEAEIRNICCLRLELIAEKIGHEDLLIPILNEFKTLEKDSVSYVKAALASTLLRICPLIGKNKTNEYIFPVFLNLIKDDNHEIRITLVKTLDKLHEVINIDIFVQSIIPSLLEIANNKSWRIRIQIIENITIIASIMTKNLFMEIILSICINWLTDSVFAIREATCKLMKKLYEIFKGEEFEKKLLVKLNEMFVNNNYLIRNTLVLLVKEFTYEEYNIEFVEKKLIQFIFKSSKDKISNVRMNSAGVLKRISRLIKNPNIIKEIQSCLEDLKRDVDSDVINAVHDN